MISKSGLQTTVYYSVVP